MLTQYLAATRRLLQNPAAPVGLYSDADLTIAINVARGQVAGESESIRRIGTISATVGLNGPYNFSALSMSTPSATNAVPLHVRSIFYNVGSGKKRLFVRAWEWFELYALNNPVPPSGAPVRWAQYNQGAAPGGAGTDQATAAGGSFYIDPLPDFPYVLTCDTVCYPLPLAADGDPEPLPYLWTDCVPFFAAYYALLSSQTSARRGEAEAQFGFYQTFLERARRMSNPSVNRFLFSQAQDPAQAQKLGVKLSAGNGG